MKISKPKFRVDDVLQSMLFSQSQKEVIEKKSMFEWFKEATINFIGEELILNIVAEGIDKNPEWVEYIRAQPKWKVECHCWEHKTLTKVHSIKLRAELAVAKRRIENAFDQKVTKFYPPKLAWNDITRDMAKEVGLEEIRLRFRPIHWLEGDKRATEIYFHFWDKKHIEQVNQILERCK